MLHMFFVTGLNLLIIFFYSVLIFFIFGLCLSVEALWDSFSNLSNENRIVCRTLFSAMI